MFCAWPVRLLARVWLISVISAAAVSAQTFEVAHVFPRGGVPHSTLIQAADGLFYGTTWQGGAADVGTVFRMDAAGNFQTLHEFSGLDGANPAAALLEASDGFFYGATSNGGSFYAGTAFRMDHDGNLTTLHEFRFDDDGEGPSTLIEGSDGLLYGALFEGGAGNGALFRMDTGGNVEILHSFNGSDGGVPRAALLEISPGLFLGTSQSGGDFNGGTFYRLDAATETLTSLHSFSGNGEGANPVAPFIRGSDGYFYTTASAGGVGGGALFRIDADGNMTTLRILAGPDGVSPEGPLVQATDGFFYGTTQSTLFRLGMDGSFAVVHTFAPSEAAQVEAGLALGSDGRLYGTGQEGGEGDTGSIYSADLSGDVTVLHSFQSVEGLRPIAGLTLGPDGFLYGVNALGGKHALGTVYRMNTAARVATLHSFDASDVGSTPAASLLFAADGYLYGTTGAYGATGSVFRMTPTGSLTLLAPFDPGDSPSALIAGPDGNLYGTTPYGDKGTGTVLRVDASGNVTTLHVFAGDEGFQPVAALLLGQDGNMYGTTSQGGQSSLGTVYRVTTDGDVTVLHSFSGADGATPMAALIRGTDGLLYGTTWGGGTGFGTIFRISTSGDFETLYDFGSDGINPMGALVQASDGFFYGTTYQGQSNGIGSVFRVDASGALETLHEFNGDDGSFPQSGLVEATDGNLYGVAGLTYGGGNVVYRIVLPSFAVTRAVPSSLPYAGGAFVRVGGAGFSADAALAIGGQTVEGTGNGGTEIDATAPALAPGTLNDATVTNGDGSSAVLADAFFADFLDVSDSSLFHRDVETIVRYRITVGCGGGEFCPDRLLTREEMAVVLLKTMHPAPWQPPSCTGLFADVVCPGPFTDWIEELAREGITGGCDQSRFCPSEPVTREEAAPLLLKSEHGAAFVPPHCSGVFADVPCPSLFADWIEQLVREDVTAGCLAVPASYCPESPAPREAAATLIVRTFKLP
jgi:uncharacterized repeat protein (TIGR03803 family)